MPVLTVTAPVKTVATALTANLAALKEGGAEGGRRWAALSAALKEGGCTSCPDDLGSLQDAVESWNSPSADAFWGELVPFACEQANRFEELFTEPIAIVDADAGGVGGVSRVVEWTQAQCLCIQCNAFLCSWPERTSSNCGCKERDARALDLPSINLDEMHCGAGNRGAPVPPPPPLPLSPRFPSRAARARRRSVSDRRLGGRCLGSGGEVRDVSALPDKAKAAHRGRRRPHTQGALRPPQDREAARWRRRRRWRGGGGRGGGRGRGAAGAGLGQLRCSAQAVSPPSLPVDFSLRGSQNQAAVGAAG